VNLTFRRTLSWSVFSTDVGARDPQAWFPASVREEEIVKLVGGLLVCFD
jgi:hypothetical protein